VNLSGRSVIAGVGESEQVRRPTRSVPHMCIEAALLALEDAGLSPRDVDAIITDDEMAPSVMVGSEMAAALDIERTFMIQAPSGGAGYAYAPLLAAMAIEAGEASVVLCFIGLDFGNQQPGASTYDYVLEPPDRAEFEIPFGFVGTPVYYAMAAQRYRALYGLTDEQMGSLAIAIRNHGARHPGAALRKSVTMADYLASPMIADPLRRLDCCVLASGAAAFVVVSPERARDLRRRPVVMLGAGFSSTNVVRRHFWVQRPEFPSTRTDLAARRAYAMAGLTPADIDVVGVQDPYTISALTQIEACGFCGRGEAGAFVEGGRVAWGGELPVNTNGGQLSHSYLMSVPHIIEAVRQLRHEAPANQVEGAEVALVSGMGPGDNGVLILGRG
jgi:acetyl-CoA acetyltransferase